jgi:hypothetical protein
MLTISKKILTPQYICDLLSTIPFWTWWKKIAIKTEGFMMQWEYIAFQEWLKEKASVNELIEIYAKIKSLQNEKLDGGKKTKNE